jgi:hypothetical protein
MEHHEPDWAYPAGQDAPEQVAAHDAEGPPETVPATGEAAAQASLPEAVPATGEPRVDAALKLLERLPGLAVADHAELFEQVHAQLSEVLGELETGPSSSAGG